MWTARITVQKINSRIRGIIERYVNEGKLDRDDGNAKMTTLDKYARKDETSAISQRELKDLIEIVFPNW